MQVNFVTYFYPSRLLRTTADDLKRLADVRCFKSFAMTRMFLLNAKQTRIHTEVRLSYGPQFFARNCNKQSTHFLLEILDIRQCPTIPNQILTLAKLPSKMELWTHQVDVWVSVRVSCLWNLINSDRNPNIGEWNRIRLGNAVFWLL